jgi:ribonucleoside-diphosphate reductase alpha chain
MEIKEWLGEDNQISIDIWNKKYRYNNETLDEWFDRVSGGNEELKQLIKDKKFLFGGRALSNRNTDGSGSYFNCYSSGYCPDDLEGIMQLNTELALTYKKHGGQGVSLSKIRPN